MRASSADSSKTYLAEVVEYLIELGQVPRRLVGQLSQDGLVGDGLDARVAGQVDLLDRGRDPSIVLLQDLAQARIVQLGKVLRSHATGGGCKLLIVGGQRRCLEFNWHPSRYLELVNFVLKGRKGLTERLQDLHLPPGLGEHGGLLVLFRRR